MGMDGGAGWSEVSFSPLLISIRFIFDDDMAIVWTYVDLPHPLTGALILYDFCLDPSL